MVVDEATMRIGRRIRTARGERPREELADEVGVALATWSRWEGGRLRVGPERQVAVADALGVDWAWLFDPRYDPEKNGAS